MKLLLIEDEAELAHDMAAYLSSESYVCEFAPTFTIALQKIELYTYDCILLDLMLPGGSGIEILKRLKALNKTDGVIIISAKDSIPDKIAGLNLGADDYLAKPFHLSELAARIHSIIRRKQFGTSNLIVINELEIDLLGKSTKCHSSEVPLTKKEFELLLFFIGNKNKVIHKSALAEHLSGDIADMMDNHDFVYAHIKNLKKKLTDAGCGNYIKTIYGTGYKWQSETTY